MSIHITFYENKRDCTCKTYYPCIYKAGALFISPNMSLETWIDDYLRSENVNICDFLSQATFRNPCPQHLLCVSNSVIDTFSPSLLSLTAAYRYNTKKKRRQGLRQTGRSLQTDNGPPVNPFPLWAANEHRYCCLLPKGAGVSVQNTKVSMQAHNTVSGRFDCNWDYYSHKYIQHLSMHNIF